MDRSNTSTIPDGACLVDGPVDLNGRTSRERELCRAMGVAVPEDGSRGEDRRREPAGDDDDVVRRGLISSEENRAGLADVKVKGGVLGLEGVGALDLYQDHLMALDPKV